MNEDNKFPNQSRFRDRETAISQETNKLIQSLNTRDSSESDSEEEKSNLEKLRIFEKYGNIGDWWKKFSVQPMLIKISERVSRTPALQQEWKLKDIVRQVEDSFKYCKMGNQYDRGCMGARMGNIQKYISYLEAANVAGEQE